MNILSSNHLLENIFFQITYAAERKCTPDWHFKGKTVYDRHNLILIYDGEATLRCNETMYKVKKGDLIYFRPGDTRFGTTNAENLMKCFTVDFFYTHFIFQKGKWLQESIPLPFSTIDTIHDSFLYPRLSKLFSDFIHTWLLNDPNRIIRAKSIFREILFLLLSWKTTDNFSYDHIRKIEKSIDFIAKNYNQKITLQDLADNANSSPTYFEFLFKKTIGKSPINYLLFFRLQKAKELILDGHSISSAALHVGFSDVFYFSKYFKKVEGISPSLFLKNRHSL